ncbi:MAG: RNA-binding protein [Acidobacteriota bacterium]|nr:RNA-binding protein [Acidobacteriota bacterium]
MSTKLFVGNLSPNVTSEDLEDLFTQIGEVVSSNVITDRVTGRSRGFGFVEMASSETAQAAIQQLHDREFEGRRIVVNEARPRQPRSEVRSGEWRGGGGGRRGSGGRRPRRDSPRSPRW